MSKAQTSTGKKEEQRKSHQNYDAAKADIDHKCDLYPGYREVVEDVRDVLQFLGSRTHLSAFDMEHKTTPRSRTPLPLDDRY